jgi:hypothetical protein
MHKIQVILTDLATESTVSQEKYYLEHKIFKYTQTHTIFS